MQCVLMGDGCLDLIQLLYILYIVLYAAQAGAGEREFQPQAADIPHERAAAAGMVNTADLPSLSFK